MSSMCAHLFFFFFLMCFFFNVLRFIAFCFRQSSALQGPRVKDLSQPFFDWIWEKMRPQAPVGSLETPITAHSTAIIMTTQATAHTQ